MIINRKVISIVALGLIACLLTFTLNHHFSRKNLNNQRLLSRIQQLAGNADNIRLNTIKFIQTGDPDVWKKITGDVGSLQQSVASAASEQWKQKLLLINQKITTYHNLLTRIQTPALLFNQEKDKLQQIGLSFAMEIREQIIIPYQKEEGISIYQGSTFDPFKRRIKETAYDLMALHGQQQLILTELLLDWDLTNYRLKKEQIAETMDQHKTRLRYLNLLMRDRPGMDRLFNSLETKLSELIQHEKQIVKHFSELDGINKDLAAEGTGLVGDCAGLAREIQSDISRADRLNRSLNWILLIAILCGMGSLGAILARDIIHIVRRQKQNEEELRQLRNYLSNIIDSMPSILVAVDQNGHVTQWNNQTERATGVSSAQARNQPLGDVFPRLAGAMDRIKASIRENRVISSSKVSFKTDRETRFEDITIFPLTANGVEGVVIRVDDVTEKVRMEEMMIQSEKMLSVGGLAAGMAHEINNPLAGMLQNANVMKSRLENTNMPANMKAAEALGVSMEDIKAFMEKRDVFRMIDAIHDSGIRAAEIVGSMLSFARKSDAGFSSHRPEQLMDKILELAATDYNLKKEYDFKSIEIVKEYEPNLPMLPCEGAKIQQVLLNILRNGAQAMQGNETESPKFIIRIYNEKTTATVCMEIEDNGPGMDEETCSKIFDPFFTTKPVGIGTGLGLSVSYFIITENHNGTMEVVSEPFKGTNFIIRLPIHRESGI